MVTLRHPHSDRGLDAYQTPPEATKALLKHEPLPKDIWECGCGYGTGIVKPLRDAGHNVVATDIVDYGCPDSKSGIDFLTCSFDGMPKCVLTNPPFMHAQKFVERALEHCDKVVMLLRLAFLESERRSNILDNGELARVLVFKNRLPMMHREGWTGPRTTSTIPFAWFVWEKISTHGLPLETTIKRIRWEKE